MSKSRLYIHRLGKRFFCLSSRSRIYTIRHGFRRICTPYSIPHRTIICGPIFYFQGNFRMNHDRNL
jgi:hypothetical protein